MHWGVGMVGDSSRANGRIEVVLSAEPLEDGMPLENHWVWVLACIVRARYQFL